MANEKELNYLEVGVDLPEAVVILNIPATEFGDEHYYTFSPDQAHRMARLLTDAARSIELQYRSVSKSKL